MSAKTRPYRSGFCGSGNPDDSHARCPGAYDGEACACDCHAARSSWVDYDMPEDDYHTHPSSVSASDLKRILDCPARYQHERTVPRQPRTVFDVGHAAHAKVLGVGAPVTVVEVDHKRGNA